MFTLVRETVIVAGLAGTLLLAGVLARKAEPLLASGFGEKGAADPAGSPAPIRDFAVSPDGRYLVTHSGMNRIALRDAQTGNLLGEMAPYVEGVNGYHTSFVAVSGRTARVLVGFADGTIYCAGHEAFSGGVPGPERRIRINDSVMCAQFAPGGGQIAMGTQDRDVLLLSADLEIEQRIPAHAGSVFAIAYAPDGNSLYTVGTDGFIRHWDIRTSALLKEVAGGQDAILELAISPDGTRIATLGTDLAMKVWSTGTWESEWHVSFRPESPVSVAFSPDGRRVACGLNCGDLTVFDVASGRRVADLDGHLRTVSGLQFLGDGATLVSGGFDGMLRFWHVDTKAEMRQVVEYFDRSAFGDDEYDEYNAE